MDLDSKDSAMSESLVKPRWTVSKDCESETERERKGRRDGEFVETGGKKGG